MSRPSDAACPAHSGEKSPEPCASALARNGASAPAASGNSGATSDIGPTSRIRRLMMPRAGRPVMRLVNAVPSSRADLSAARCAVEIFASGHHRYAVPICTPAAPSAKAAAMPRASVMAPAAMAAGLIALRDHGVDAARFEPARLGGGGRRTHHQEASRLEALQERWLRQPEVEAHDVGLRLLDDIAHDGIERGAVARRDRRGGIY